MSWFRDEGTKYGHRVASVVTSLASLLWFPVPVLPPDTPTPACPAAIVRPLDRSGAVFALARVNSLDCAWSTQWRERLREERVLSVRRLALGAGVPRRPCLLLHAFLPPQRWTHFGERLHFFSRVKGF
ncbi:hypothetical protein C8R45DRAFT_1099702 [Mycena sanguinolenta]|nr:hypothetical protein C8R45DRAFT_1099702 [Mycena sanguinolenta]